MVPAVIEVWRWQLLKDHHEGYIDWAEFERNQSQLAANAYGKAGGAKSARGGRALLAGLVSCGRCGRKLTVAYTGRQPRQAVYRCDRLNQMLGIERCLSFGGSRVDTTIAEEILRVVEPMAIEAALEAERMSLGNEAERRRMAELDLQQARYDAALAERRYAACDPDNRLIAAQLEASWEAALERVQACETRLHAMRSAEPPAGAPTLYGLAEDLTTAWMPSLAGRIMATGSHSRAPWHRPCPQRARGPRRRHRWAGAHETPRRQGRCAPAQTSAPTGSARSGPRGF